MLTVGVLGPLEVRRDGRPLPVPSGKTTELLARLALDAGQVVSAERLIEDLWGEAAAATGRNTLQSKVSQLRRALADPVLVAGGHGGYTLALDPGRVDAVRVAGLAADVAAARRDGDAAAALEAATEALALFRGEILADAGDGTWLYPHRTRLEEVRLGLLEDRAAARVDLGAGGDAIAELEWLVGEHPLRERLWASHITALYRAGRRARHRAGEGAGRPRAPDPAPERRPRPRRDRPRAGAGPGRRQPARPGHPPGRAGRGPRRRRPADRRQPAGHPGRAGRGRQDPHRP
jgi:DNA-binding SARP family transcriptional activator